MSNSNFLDVSLLQWKDLTMLILRRKPSRWSKKPLTRMSSKTMRFVELSLLMSSAETKQEAYKQYQDALDYFMMVGIQHTF